MKEQPCFWSLQITSDHVTSYLMPAYMQRCHFQWKFRPVFDAFDHVISRFEEITI